jgi:response regulator of citrate/malate metabolism
MVKDKKNIVIVDDSRTSLQLIQSLIMEDFPDIMIHAYLNSLTAYNNLKNVLADLYIIDVHMPHMNGFDILSNISTLNSPVFFVSASSDLPLLEKAFSMGASEYFVKPFDVNKFKSKISQVLKAY